MKRNLLLAGLLAFAFTSCNSPEAPGGDEGAGGEAEKAGGEAAKAGGEAAKAGGEASKEAAWVELFDGKSMNGWKASENKEAWSVKDGHLVCKGNRSHLFYVADEKPFVNFILEAEIMTLPNRNSGIYFHTQYQEKGWPKYGFETQVNNTYKDPQKTAGLYDIAKVLSAPAKDNEWFTLRIHVNGKKVQTKVNGETIVDYDEPADQKAGKNFTRLIDKGTFALQAHDPGSEVHYRRIRVQRLP